MSCKSRAKPPSPSLRFNSSPEVIRLVVLMYVRFPLSLRNVEDLLFERGIDLCHETVRFWWNRFGPMFAGEARASASRGCVASSLYQLRQLRFDQLKIDGSFVHTMSSPESAKIVSAVAGLGKALGMPVTAEGVETSEEADALRALGCEHGQGFLFGKPLDAAGTMAMLNRIARGKVALIRTA